MNDWTEVLLASLVGGVAATLAWIVLRPVFAAEVLLRRNFRNREVPVGGGLALVLTVLVALALAVIAQVAWNLALLDGAEGAVIVALLGFALLGFVDDVLGSGRERGFRGHLRELARGRLTAGGLKLFGGGAIAVGAVYMSGSGSGSLADLLRDAALIALAANLANLFDLAPGRAIKWVLVAFVSLLVGVGGDVILRSQAVVVGGAAALLWPDVREKLMLGDTGANPLGAVIGLGVVMACAPTTRLIVAVVLLALNLASEFVSFSRVIAAVPPLRLLDGVGRLR